MVCELPRAEVGTQSVVYEEKGRDMGLKAEIRELIGITHQVIYVTFPIPTTMFYRFQSLC